MSQIHDILNQISGVMTFEKLASIFRLNDVYLCELYQNEPIGKELPDILFYLKVWRRMAMILRLIHMLLGFSATFFSILAVAQIGVTDAYAKVFAFIAAVSIALMTAFNLGGKSNDTRAAWRHLNAAIMKFNKKITDNKGVIRAYEEAEVLIGDVTYQNK